MYHRMSDAVLLKTLGTSRSNCQSSILKAD